VLDWVQGRGVTLTIDPEIQLADGDSHTWCDVPHSLRYAENAAPFQVEVNMNTAPDSLAAQEIHEFLQELRTLKKSRKRDRVIEHLQHTKFTVPCQIPISEFDDAGFHAIDVFLAYFLVHCDGLIQADGQGFYEMGQLIVEME